MYVYCSEACHDDGYCGPFAGGTANRCVSWVNSSSSGMSRLRVSRAFQSCLPNVVGLWFPRRGHSYAPMLAPLRPWRQLEMLKTPTWSWEEEFSALIDGALQHVLDALVGIQCYYDSKDVAIRQNAGDDVEEENEIDADDDKSRLG